MDTVVFEGLGGSPEPGQAAGVMDHAVAGGGKGESGAGEGDDEAGRITDIAPEDRLSDEAGEEPRLYSKRRTLKGEAYISLAAPWGNDIKEGAKEAGTGEADVKGGERKTPQIMRKKATEGEEAKNTKEEDPNE